MGDNIEHGRKVKVNEKELQRKNKQRLFEIFKSKSGI